MKWIQASGDCSSVRVFQLWDDYSSFGFLRYYPSIRQFIWMRKGKEKIFSLSKPFFLPGQFNCRNTAGLPVATLWIENRTPGAGKIMVEKKIFTFSLTGPENNISLLLYTAQIRLPLLQCDLGLSMKKKQDKFLFAALLSGLGFYISEPPAQNITPALRPFLGAV